MTACLPPSATLTVRHKSDIETRRLMTFTVVTVGTSAKHSDAECVCQPLSVANPRVTQPTFQRLCRSRFRTVMITVHYTVAWFLDRVQRPILKKKKY
jgi:hypothetical protein